MWTITVISLIGMTLFFSFACTIVISYDNITKWLRLGIAWTSIFMMFGMIWLLTMTRGLIETRKEVHKEKPKYELIQEPVYRKIK
jgi:hypothetical protein